MILTLVPIRMDARLSLAREGEALVVNGERIDLSAATGDAPLDLGARDADGPPLAPHPWIVGPVTRRGGRLHLSVLLPLGPEAPEAARFPAPLALDADGPVPLPGQDAPRPGGGG